MSQELNLPELPPVPRTYQQTAREHEAIREYGQTCAVLGFDAGRAPVPAAQQAGWVSVPVEPTPEMLSAFFAEDTQRKGYVAMIAAAPCAPAEAMDWPLPCDITVGAGTIKAGLPLRTLVARMGVMADMIRDGWSSAKPAAEAASVRDQALEEAAELAEGMSSHGAFIADHIRALQGKPEAAKGGELTDEQIDRMWRHSCDVGGITTQEFTRHFARAIEQHIKGGGTQGWRGVAQAAWSDALASVASQQQAGAVPDDKER